MKEIYKMTKTYKIHYQDHTHLTYFNVVSIKISRKNNLVIRFKDNSKTIIPSDRWLMYEVVA